MQQQPYTPLVNIPWIRWIDRTEVPAMVIGFVAWLVFLPLYDFAALAPRVPLQAAAYPPAFALALMFLLQLSRGATQDLQTLIVEKKTDLKYLVSLAASPRMAKVELGVGLVFGVERCLAQISFTYGDVQSGIGSLGSGAIAVCLSIVFYTVVQVHLITFGIRQVIVFRRVAKNFKVDLLRPELNSVLTNPFIRYFVVGLLVMSFGMIIYQLVPYASLQKRVLEGSFFMMSVWLFLVLVSLLPLLILRSRTAVAKKLEISMIRRALKGETSDLSGSQFGERLASFDPADLMYYEDRIKSIWEWPFEAHIRRLVLFGLLPPLTWILAAAVEVIFETMLVS